MRTLARPVVLVLELYVLVALALLVGAVPLLPGSSFPGLILGLALGLLFLGHLFSVLLLGHLFS